MGEHHTRRHQDSVQSATWHKEKAKPGPREAGNQTTVSPLRTPRRLSDPFQSLPRFFPTKVNTDQRPNRTLSGVRFMENGSGD